MTLDQLIHDSEEDSNLKLLSQLKSIITEHLEVGNYTRDEEIYYLSEIVYMDIPELQNIIAILNQDNVPSQNRRYHVLDQEMLVQEFRNNGRINKSDISQAVEMQHYFNS